MPDKLEWLKNQADAMTECGDTAGALQLLKTLLSGLGRMPSIYSPLVVSILCSVRLRKPRSMLSGRLKRTVLSRLSFSMILRLMRCGIVFEISISEYLEFI